MEVAAVSDVDAEGRHEQRTETPSLLELIGGTTAVVWLWSRYRENF
ncbi:hypothetical protein [Specibacter cremeus]|nr:hypothetical protein [Specibacter cremeus]